MSRFAWWAEMENRVQMQAGRRTGLTDDLSATHDAPSSIAASSLLWHNRFYACNSQIVNDIFHWLFTHPLSNSDFLVCDYCPATHLSRSSTIARLFGQRRPHLPSTHSILRETLPFTPTASLEHPPSAPRASRTMPVYCLATCLHTLGLFASNVRRHRDWEPTQ